MTLDYTPTNKMLKIPLGIVRYIHISKEYIPVTESLQENIDWVYAEKKQSKSHFTIGLQ